jgi:DNA-3-methyladenine glycosylase
VRKKLTRKFFIRDATTVAKELLGKYLVHNYKGIRLSGKIVETEAYIGPEDRASHGYQNKITERNKAEFYIGGHIYIYLVYGMYWQLNISTGDEGVPECVLIRALEPEEGIEEMKKNRGEENIKNLTNGPGKLCQAMKLDKSCYGLDICKSKEIYIEDRGEKIRKEDIVSAKRIGIDYAAEWKDKLLRFYIKDNIFVSKK